MKKLMTIFGAILFASVILTSCGGDSIEKDAKKAAEFQCKSIELAQKAKSGDMSVMAESAKLATEFATFRAEMKEKYTSEADQKKFEEALLKETANCN
jgi:major membrane immunogen (membrane-anchored lipoprotein)